MQFCLFLMFIITTVSATCLLKDNLRITYIGQIANITTNVLSNERATIVLNNNDYISYSTTERCALSNSR